MNFSSTTDNLITPRELSDLFKISKASVYRLIGKRVLPSHKVGGSLRFSKRDVEEYLNRVRIEPIRK